MEKERIISPFWVRYVDDGFAVISRQDATSVLATLNNIPIKVAFTMGMDHSLSFLNIKIMNKDRRMEYDILKKIIHA